MCTMGVYEEIFPKIGIFNKMSKDWIWLFYNKSVESTNIILLKELWIGMGEKKFVDSQNLN